MSSASAALPRLLLVACLALGCSALRAGDVTPERSKALLTRAEWQLRCSTHGGDGEACLIRAIRPPVKAGRSAAYGIAPASPEALMTRSGVLLVPHAREQIAGVREDNGQRSILSTTSGIQCLTFSAPFEASASFLDKHRYESFLRFVTEDAQARVATSEQTWLAGREAVVFEPADEGIVGALIPDPPNNAGIWVACSAGESGNLRTLTREFLTLIEGSARRY